MEVIHVVSKQPAYDEETGAYKVKCYVMDWLYFKDQEVAERLIKKSQEDIESFSLDELTKNRSIDYDG